jgi:hypothetical protein
LIPLIVGLSAAFGGFLLIADLAETPELERRYLELALFAPLVVWLVTGRLRLRR